MKIQVVVDLEFSGFCPPNAQLPDVIASYHGISGFFLTLIFGKIGVALKSAPPVTQVNHNPIIGICITTEDDRVSILVKPLILDCAIILWVK